MLIDSYDVALLDLDGVVYRGHHPIENAADSLAKARAQGMRLAYVTNNASRTPSAVAALLTGLGIPTDGADVVTSSQAAARVLSERLSPGAKVLVVGGTALRHAVYARGLRPVSTALEGPEAVVQGFTPDLSYGLIAQGVQAVLNGALFVASNADLTISAPYGPNKPGNGSLIRVIQTATGVAPVVAGKPEISLHRESILRTGAERPLVVGDRLDTDIEGAFNGGADSLLVFTGVTDPLTALTAEPRHRATYMAPDLTGLLADFPDVEENAGRYTCAGWTAAWDGEAITLSGAGDKWHGLRALAAAAFRTPEPASPEAVSSALEVLGLR
ncbi:HAD-IIA family hydrolase [Actinocorallia sp. A-T 12471]|uniref:HAD-IIA family hydrolase n=1 Tax=Actinocorallia sp. A-T 12471 TaxID=3089813 RepID=UPI0029CDC0EA|nr:HAD-IIA family hydrolase [Actinocorallia sp. A-T 12471]MDX6744901.1 HAD-IIA family hydrolase [Actinocorallia sp. A-T 12471]